MSCVPVCMLCSALIFGRVDKYTPVEKCVRVGREHIRFLEIRPIHNPVAVEDLSCIHLLGCGLREGRGSLANLATRGEEFLILVLRAEWHGYF
jgi:hypothetical protein